MKKAINAHERGTKYIPCCQCVYAYLTWENGYGSFADASCEIGSWSGAGGSGNASGSSACANFGGNGTCGKTQQFNVCTFSMTNVFWYAWKQILVLPGFWSGSRARPGPGLAVAIFGVCWWVTAGSHRAPVPWLLNRPNAEVRNTITITQCQQEYRSQGWLLAHNVLF